MGESAADGERDVRTGSTAVGDGDQGVIGRVGVGLIRYGIDDDRDQCRFHGRGSLGDHGHDLARLGSKRFDGGQRGQRQHLRSDVSGNPGRDGGGPVVAIPKLRGHPLAGDAVTVQGFLRDRGEAGDDDFRESVLIWMWLAENVDRGRRTITGAGQSEFVGGPSGGDACGAWTASGRIGAYDGLKLRGDRLGFRDLFLELVPG